VRLLGSGTILREVLAAAELLADDWSVASDVFSVTSFSELARDARDVERWNRLHPESEPRRSHVEALLGAPGSMGNRSNAASGSSSVPRSASMRPAPVVAATDYVRAYPQLIAPYVDARFVALGTDGFGRSDSRAALRGFFEVDRQQIALAALDALARDGVIGKSVVAAAIARYGIDPETPPSWTR
jgi:pyruvate dehydrogenase E1 component